MLGGDIANCCGTFVSLLGSEGLSAFWEGRGQEEQLLHRFHVLTFCGRRVASVWRKMHKSLHYVNQILNLFVAAKKKPRLNGTWTCTCVSVPGTEHVSALQPEKPRTDTWRTLKATQDPTPSKTPIHSRYTCERVRKHQHPDVRHPPKTEKAGS